MGGKVRSMSRSMRKALIDRDHRQLSLVRQCSLLNVSRASVYPRPVPTRAEDLALMDREYLKTPFYGSRRMKAWLLQPVGVSQRQACSLVGIWRGPDVIGVAIKLGAMEKRTGSGKGSGNWSWSVPALAVPGWGCCCVRNWA